MKMIIKVLLWTGLTVAVLLGLGAGTLYAYLKPEDTGSPVAAAATVRTIDGGEVVGYINDQGVHVWRGIPYAEPPVGKLRWKAPRPVLPWNDTLETLASGNTCSNLGTSMSSGPAVVQGSEDCLYLNIFSPSDIEAPLPVMFWIHGGANMIGDGGGSIYDGSRYAKEHRVVLVSINYRLGALGWFTHPALRPADGTPEDNSGNYGTLDQIHALRWVQRNIAQFGGDPARVTIFGESAGGWNVLAMMASPLARGLFHGAIVQSGRLDIDPISEAENYVDADEPGSPLSSREIINGLLQMEGRAADATAARRLQESMSDQDIAAYLYGKSTAELLATYRYEPGNRRLILPNLLADGSVLPSGVSAQEVFADAEHYNAVPVILGTNLDEMKLFLPFNPGLVGKIMGVPLNILDIKRYNKFNRYASDEWKVNGVDRLASAMRKAQGETVFAYRFDAKDLRHLGLVDLRDLLGAAHALELPYVFGSFIKPTRVIFPESSREAREALSRSIMSYWAEFAYTGNPGNGRDGREVTWTPWLNEGEQGDRLMILDSTSGNGVRMSDEYLTIDMLKQRLYADTSFRNQEEYCEAYKTLFKRRDFVMAEYEDLGLGCPAMTN